jgi:photosystem II stability/assembly factor-like uncharacterized protein
MSANDYSYFGLYRSADGGNTFTLRSNSPNILGMLSNGSSPGGQGWYDLALAVSPTAANTVMVGGINVWSSTNGGTNWSCVGRGYGAVTDPSHIHPDVHSLYFKPGSGTVVYCCNDGGVFKSTNTGSQWNDISSGLQIMEFYSISSSQTSATTVLGGAQDNGANLYSSGLWASVAQGDGMHVAIDYSNANNMYEEQPFGDMSFSNDGGISWPNISPDSSSGGNWVTPFVIDPNNHNTIYAGLNNPEGYNTLFKSTDQGSTWTMLPHFLSSGITFIEAIAVAPSNSNFIYVATGPEVISVAGCNVLYKTTNGGTSWATITGTLPLNNAPLTCIAVKSNDPNSVWITCSNYLANDKVFKTTNGGTTWVNITGNLPNVPVNCIVYVPNTPNGVFIGTDLGVFYSDDYTGGWINFNTNLPNVIVNQLDIQTATHKLRAGTFGRGLWETPIPASTNINVVNTTSNSTNIFPNPTTGEVFVNFPANENTNISVFNVIGDLIDDVTIESSGLNQTKIDLSKQPKGIYLIRIQTGETVSTEKVVLMK